MHSASSDSAVRLRVLSIQSEILGNRVYALAMRRAFEQRVAEVESGAGASVELDSCWLTQDRDILTRIIGRLLCARVPIRRAAEANLDFNRFRSELGLGLIGRRLAGRRMRDRAGGAYHVLHFHTPVCGFLSSDLMRRVPTVLSGDMTVAQAAREMQGGHPAWTHRPSIAWEKRLMHQAARVVFWSRWAARSAIEEYSLPPEKIHVVYPGLDSKLFDRPASAASTCASTCSAPHGVAQPELRSVPVRLLFVGGDFRRKGGDDLLQVFLELDRESVAGASLELHLVTEAPIDLVRGHPRIRVHAGVQAWSREWLERYHSADIFVMPTRSEAFGLAFIEAMTMGLPIVATRINAIPEIVAHGETGFLIEPGDRVALAKHLRALIASPALRARMGEAGRRVAQSRFEARANFLQLEEVFRKAASFESELKQERA